MSDVLWVIEHYKKELEYYLKQLDDMKKDVNNSTYNDALGYLNECIDGLQEVLEEHESI